MKSWKYLKSWQKGVIGLSILIASLAMPELMFLTDLGGIELVFGFMVLYYQSIIAWFEQKITELKRITSIIHANLVNSVLSRPKMLSFHAVYCVTVFSVTGSLLFSMSFLSTVFFIGIEYL